jgi:hypothetical protein
MMDDTVVLVVKTEVEKELLIKTTIFKGED